MKTTSIKFSLGFVVCFMLMVVQSIAQDHKDCLDALVLCGESPFTLEFVLGVGEEDAGLDGSCLMEEFSSIWIALNIESAGQVIFDITPEGDFTDIDFAIFKLNDGTCDNKTVVRCMASGESGGQSSSENSPCTGPTGLAFGELDNFELAGCTNSSNNYLAPLSVEAGEQYVLLINDFSLSGATAEITFGGSAEIECMEFTSSNDELDSQKEWMSISSISGQLAIQIDDAFSNGELQVYGADGKLLLSKEVFGNDYLQFNDLNYVGLSVVTLRSDEKYQREKVFIFR